MNTINTESSSASGSFDDSLLELLVTGRPRADENSQQKFQQLIGRLLELCGDDVQRWKAFVLLVLHRRYHLLAPEAKALMCDKTKHSDIMAGEGERQSFYETVRCIFEEMLKNEEETKGRKSQTTAALKILIKLAPDAGGSRDVAALLEILVETLIGDSLEKEKVLMMDRNGKESLTSLIASGVRVVLQKMNEEEESGVLLDLLKFAGATLDHDMELVSRFQTETEGIETKSKAAVKELPSTLHIFIPHHGRGKRNAKKRVGNAPRDARARSATANKVPKRQLVQSICEILIWSRTRHGLDATRFTSSLQEFLRAARKDDIKKHLFTMQAMIRKWRKVLNSYSRQKGFMITDQFAKDANGVTMGMVSRAKAGDLSELTRVATKKGAAAQETLRMIQLRFSSNPKKVTRYASIREMRQCAEALIKTSSSSDPEEIVEVERSIHFARIRASLEYLRKMVKRETESQVVIASMEKSQDNHIAALMVAAVLAFWSFKKDGGEGSEPEYPPPKLLIGGVEKRINSFEEWLLLLDRVVEGLEKNETDAPSFMTAEGTVTTKAVLNLLERHLGENKQRLLLLTSADIRLPNETIEDLKARDCSIHCHDTSDFGERLLREKAKKGDITISLAWDTEDDLDLHVYVPPHNEHIHYGSMNSKDRNCMLDVDMNASSPRSKEPVENIICGDLDSRKEAPLGLYKVQVQNYAYRTKGEAGREIPFQVVIQLNGKKLKYKGVTKGSGSASTTTVVEFEYHGRTVPFPGEEEIVTAFGTSTLVNVTSSSGQNLEAMTQLVQAVQQHQHLSLVHDLVTDAKEDVNESNEEDQREQGAEVMTFNTEGVVNMNATALPGTLDVTSRDRIQILLAKLPTRFHAAVGESFGGQSLVDHCAEALARRMLEQRIPIAELKKNGWPDDVVQAVKSKMGTTL